MSRTQQQQPWSLLDPPSTGITTCGSVPKIEECDVIEDVKDPQQQPWSLLDPPSTGITTCGTVPKIEQCDLIEDVKDQQQQPWSLLDPPSVTGITTCGTVPKIEECDVIEDVKDPQQQPWSLLDPPSTGITTCGTVPKIEQCDLIEDVEDQQQQPWSLLDPPSTGITTCGTVPKIEECDLIEDVKDQQQPWSLLDPTEQHGGKWTRDEIKVETREDGDSPTPSGRDAVAIETGKDDEDHDFKASSLSREDMSLYTNQIEYQVKVSLFGKTDVKYKIKVTRSSDNDFHSVTYEPVREARRRIAWPGRRTEVMSTCMWIFFFFCISFHKIIILF